MPRIAHAALLALALCGPDVARAAVLHVDASSGNDASDGLTWGTARVTVRSALATALATPEADTILVAEGVYRERIIVPPDVALLGGHPPGGGPADPQRHPTVLDGEHRGGVVEFGPGTDGSVMDGFTIRHGRRFSETAGGGVTVTGAAPAIRRCIVERNAGKFGGGVHASEGWPTFDDCVIRQNVATAWGAAIFIRMPGNDPRVPRFRRTRIEDNEGVASVWAETGTGSVIMVHGGAGSQYVNDADPFLDDCLVQRNAVRWYPRNDRPAYVGGAIMLLMEPLRRSRIRNTLFRDNTRAVVENWTYRTNSVLDVFENCEFTGHDKGVVALKCSTGLEMNNCTVSGNTTFLHREGGLAPVHTLVRIRRSIVTDPLLVGDFGCYFPDIEVHDSILPAPFTTGSNIVVGAPTFVSAPAGDFALAQVSAGEPAESLGVDAGPEMASDLGLDAVSTRSDGLPDAGLVDWGVHYGAPWPESSAGGGGVPTGSLEIVRGSHPLELDRIAIVPDLPFTDNRGVLSDPGLRLLYYRARWMPRPMRVIKERALDTVTLLE